MTSRRELFGAALLVLVAASTLWVAASTLWHGSLVATPAVETSDCLSADEEVSAVLQRQLSVGFGVDAKTVRALVDALREQQVSLSLIEADCNEPLGGAVSAATVGEVLRIVVERHPQYRCEVVAGRLILRSSDPLFDTTIAGVDLVDRYRFPATYAYIDHLRAFDARFASWRGPLVATAGSAWDSPLFDTRVTLAPRAPLIQHLVQFLGDDPAVYFTVPAACPHGMDRTIRLRALQEPWPARAVRP